MTSTLKEVLDEQDRLEKERAAIVLQLSQIEAMLGKIGDALKGERSGESSNGQQATSAR